MKASELASTLGGALEGSDVDLVACAGLEEARKGDLSFCKDPKHVALVQETKASAVLLPKDWDHGAPCAVIRVKDPNDACMKAAAIFAPPPPVRAPGVHPTAIVDPSVTLGKRVHVGAYTVIEKGAEIGDDCVIEAQVFVGENCRLGAGCHIYPQVTLREGSVLGKKVMLHCGVRIGGDGYGYTTSVGLTGIKIEKIPQLGIVELGDGVEIGSTARASVARTSGRRRRSTTSFRSATTSRSRAIRASSPRPASRARRRSARAASSGRRPGSPATSRLRTACRSGPSRASRSRWTVRSSTCSARPPSRRRILARACFCRDWWRSCAPR